MSVDRHMYNKGMSVVEVMVALSVWVFFAVLFTQMLNQAQLNIKRSAVFESLRIKSVLVLNYYMKLIHENQLYINIEGEVPYHFEIFGNLATSTESFGGQRFVLTTSAIDSHTIRLTVNAYGPYGVELSLVGYVNITDSTIDLKFGALDLARDLSWCVTGIDPDKVSYKGSVFDFDSSTNITDVSGFANYIVVSAYDLKSGRPDIYILKFTNNGINEIPNVSLVGQYDIGLGATAISANYPYLYVGVPEASHQLSIYDMTWPATMKLVATSSLRLVSTSTPVVRSLAYRSRDQMLHIGIEKWSEAEYLIVDVSDRASPYSAGSFEVGSIVKDIYNLWPYTYLSTGGQLQLLSVLSSAPQLISTQSPVSGFTPSGWQTQQGSVLRRQGNRLWWGRTVGGFNNIRNHELFYIDLMSTTSPIQLPPFKALPNSMVNGSYEFTGQVNVATSTDIGSSVRDIVAGHDFAFVLNSMIGKEVLVYKIDKSKLVADRSIGITGTPVKFWCSGNNIFVAMNNPPRLVLLQGE